jgi:hypothetical protein
MLRWPQAQPAPAWTRGVTGSLEILSSPPSPSIRGGELSAERIGRAVGTRVGLGVAVAVVIGLRRRARRGSSSSDAVH